jgi:asparagine synthase (glutamine-hydrolysing)
MCGIACYLGNNKAEGLMFGNNARALLKHRGPDDNGIYNDDNITLSHTRLSILELSALGHQPMESSCGRYIICYNGEIYNHLELRKKYLPNHPYRGHSDTETIIELFRVLQENMLREMVGMWAILIWDKQQKRLFVSRSRFGQKPLYVRRVGKSWRLGSEMKTLLGENEVSAFDTTAVVEYLALGNYGHLGVNTFFKDIKHFPIDTYAWLTAETDVLDTKQYWTFPDIPNKDKVPFDKSVEKGLHDCIVEAVLSETLSDVPIGITVSGGIDSSIIAGILATYYKDKIHIYTAQSPDSKYDETRYVDALIGKFSKSNFIVHSQDLNQLSIRDSLEKYIKIQEEPFGDPSIIAHGSLMELAASTGIKVILNGQGADELFFGYNNMAQAILSKQFKSSEFNTFKNNIEGMNLGRGYLMRTLLKSVFPKLEYVLRKKSRINRRDIIRPELLENVDNDLITLYQYNNIYDVWKESIYGVHIPHLVHYDDRNAMAYSVEGRMPFLDHRIADYISKIRPEEFLKNGLRKYILREACKQYLPDVIYNRRDKIGFFTPLINVLHSEKTWISEQLRDNKLLTDHHIAHLLGRLNSNTLQMNDALQIWRSISLNIWMKDFRIK